MQVEPILKRLFSRAIGITSVVEQLPTRYEWESDQAPRRISQYLITAVYSADDTTTTIPPTEPATGIG